MTLHILTEILFLMLSVAWLTYSIIEQRVVAAVFATVATLFWLLATCGGIRAAVERAMLP